VCNCVTVHRKYLLLNLKWIVYMYHYRWASAVTGWSSICQTLCSVHIIHGIRLIYLFQVITTKLFEQSVAYNGVVIYNKVSQEIKTITYIMKFKKMIINFAWKEFLLCGRIYDYWSLIHKNCVNEVVYIVTICILYTFRLHWVSIPCCFI
jgi:hypothetical protein